MKAEPVFYVIFLASLAFAVLTVYAPATTPENPAHRTIKHANRTAWGFLVLTGAIFTVWHSQDSMPYTITSRAEDLTYIMFQTAFLLGALAVMVVTVAKYGIAFKTRAQNRATPAAV